MGSVPPGRSPGGGHDNPLQYSCLENPMDKGAWRATVHGVTESQTRLKWLSTHMHILTPKQGWYHMAVYEKLLDLKRHAKRILDLLLLMIKMILQFHDFYSALRSQKHLDLRGKIPDLGIRFPSQIPSLIPFCYVSVSSLMVREYLLLAQPFSFSFYYSLVSYLPHSLVS